jgi:hypothetical protein
MATYSFRVPRPPSFSPPGAPQRPVWQWGPQRGTEIYNPQTQFQQQSLTNRLANLPGEFMPRLRWLSAGAKAALAGYGGVKFGIDDPNTPEDESLNIEYDPNVVGERERAAINDVRWGANARNMLYSSFTDRGVADALNKVAEEARQIIHQYGQQVNETISEWYRTGSGIVEQIASLFGQDAAYYADPDAPWNQAPPVVWTGTSYPNLNTIAGRHPDWIAAGNQLQVVMTPDGRYQVILGGTGPSVGPPRPQEPTKDNLLGPWASKPNLDPSRFIVFKSGGKWYAKRR